MQLLARLAALTVLVAIVPGIVATPVQESPNDAAALQARAGLALTNQQCVSPAQINLRNDPGMNLLGSCGWKMWTVCTAFAVGVCAIPCAEGWFADPACDACLVTLGALGCKSCIEDKALHEFLVQEMVTLQPKVVASIQNQYCETPKKNLPQVKVPSPKPTNTLAA